MEEVVEFIVKSLVDDVSAVQISTEKNEDGVVIHVTVADNDLGKIIGKGGRIAQSIRTVASCIASKQKTRVFVKIGEKV
ncbi:MAG: KH domain-containing protein [Clostridia bacterium]